MAALQATVHRQCDERAEMMIELQELRMMRKQLLQQHGSGSGSGSGLAPQYSQQLKQQPHDYNGTADTPPPQLLKPVPPGGYSGGRSGSSASFDENTLPSAGTAMGFGGDDGGLSGGSGMAGGMPGRAGGGSGKLRHGGMLSSSDDSLPALGPGAGGSGSGGGGVSLSSHVSSGGTRRGGGTGYGRGRGRASSRRGGR